MNACLPMSELLVNDCLSLNPVQSHNEFVTNPDALNGFFHLLTQFSHTVTLRLSVFIVFFY